MMIKLIVNLILTVSACVCVETIYMKRSVLDDQETSESGYSYETHSGQPKVFTAFSKNDYEHFGYPPVTLGKFVVNDEPLQYLPLMNYYPQVSDTGLIDSYGKPLHHSDYSWPYSKYEDYPIIQHGNYGLGADNSKYEAENGKSYKSDHNSAQGQKGENGYNKFDGYEKGSKGSHENKGFKEFYNQKGSNNAGQYDVAKNYGSKHLSGNENKGESFKEAKGHRKGSKTTGFHKVYHKDEYKKDHRFYDDANKSGHFNKYGSFKGRKSANEGGFKEGGRLNKGYKESDYGKQGFTDKGRSNAASEGYKGADGKESHYKDYVKYDNNRGNDNKREYGYRDYENEGKY